MDRDVGTSSMDVEALKAQLVQLQQTAAAQKRELEEQGAELRALKRQRGDESQPPPDPPPPPSSPASPPPEAASSGAASAAPSTAAPSAAPSAAPPAPSAAPPTAVPPPAPPPGERDVHDSQIELGTVGAVYAAYEPTVDGPPHPTQLCVPSSLAYQPSPAEKTEMAAHLHADLSGLHVSAAQLDVVALARRRNAVDGFGFQVGDQVGVGKSRIALAWVQNNRLFDGDHRFIYVSVGSLFEQTRRDARAMGLGLRWTNAHEMKNKSTMSIPFTTDILFISHDMVKTFGPQNLVNWLYFNDPRSRRSNRRPEGQCLPGIIFDESHKLVKVSGSTRSQRAMSNFQLLTSAYEKGCHVLSMSGTFAACVAECGEGLTSETISCEIRACDRALYSECASLWADLLDVQDGEEAVFAGKQASAVYYGACLRFFRALLMSLKVDCAIERAVLALDQGMCPVVTLISTDEAALSRRCGDDDDDDDAAVSGAEEADRLQHGAILDTFLQVLKYAGKKVVSTDTLAELEQLRKRSVALELSKISAIDRVKHALATHLGGDRSKVVELTGRSKHLTLELNDDPTVLSNWKVNKRCQSLQEAKDAFQSGKSRAAVLSTAASTGVSLHHQNEAAGRRVVICLELPWSSTQFCQTMGRFHRSSELSLPRCEIITAGGVLAEQRFVSTIQRRMTDLGAITSADGRAGTSVDFDSADLCGPTTDKAAGKVADSTGLWLGCGKPTAVRFMNRCLACPVEKANELMESLVAENQSLREIDRVYGRDSGDVKTINITGNLSVAETTKLDNGSIVIKLGIDRGISFYAAVELAEEGDDTQAIRGFHRLKSAPVEYMDKLANSPLVCVESVVGDTVTLKRPNGLSVTTPTRSIDTYYDAVSVEDAREEWEFFYERALRQCIHQNCEKASCTHGMRMRFKYLLTFPCCIETLVSYVDKVQLVKIVEDDGSSRMATVVHEREAMRTLEKRQNV